MTVDFNMTGHSAALPFHALCSSSFVLNSSFVSRRESGEEFQQQDLLTLKLSETHRDYSINKVYVKPLRACIHISTSLVVE